MLLRANGLFTYAAKFYYSIRHTMGVCGLYLILAILPLLEYVAEALGTRTHATHVRIDLANYGMCMLVFVKMGNKQHPPPFWFTIKRKAVFVWVLH
jgi:hypothetical protein